MKKAEALEKMSDLMKMQRKSRNTIKVYREWLERYMDFLQTCKAETHEEKIGAFLSLQVKKHNISASTQKQALCALVYFYKHVLRLPLGDLSFCRATRIPRLPEVFSRQEVWRVLDRLDSEGWLWGALMYGCGLRLDEVCSLRVKDLDIDRRMVIVREGKGGKDRIVPLPELLIEPIHKHMRNISDQWILYAEAKVPVALPDNLGKKYPAAPYSWEWFWLFPASGPAKDPHWGGLLWHVHPTAVQKRIRRAILAARISKKAGCHTFRHSFATHWLENDEGNHELALKRLQELLGHKDVKTTMIYLHLLPKPQDIASPLDRRAA
jgi:integron integrase